jgi:hypothetical protein
MTWRMKVYLVYLALLVEVSLHEMKEEPCLCSHSDEGQLLRHGG